MSMQLVGVYPETAYLYGRRQLSVWRLEICKNGVRPARARIL